MLKSFSYHQIRSVPGVSLSPEMLTSPMSMASGGFATLWRAGDKGEYAIKCFNAGGMAAAEEEFEAMVLLSGSHVVPQVYGLGTFVDGMEEGSAAIVEEYVEGYTLSRILKRGLLTGSVRNPVFDVSTTVAIALEVARALIVLERAGVSHRDLSANNVILTRDCVSRRLKDGVRLLLIDFGQSTPVSRPSVTPSFRARLATVPYGAPEMYGGEYWRKRNSCKCDIWSFGALLVTMLVGEYWPEEIADLSMGLASTKDLERIVRAKRDPIDLVALLRSVGRSAGDEEKWLAQLVRRCTQFDPDLRPAASEVASLLEGFGTYDLARTPIRKNVRAHPADTPVPATDSPERPKTRSRDGEARMRERAVVDNRSPKDGRTSPSIAPHPAPRRAVRAVPSPQVTPPLRSASPQQLPSPWETEWTVLPQFFDVEDGMLVHYRGNERVVAIPDGVVGVGPGAFRNCKTVERVLVPESVLSIGEYAFCGCTSLVGIAMPSIRQIGMGAFLGCCRMTSVVVRDPVAEIPPYAFRDCGALESVWLPKRVRSIGREAFAGCTSLTNVELPDSLTRVGERAFHDCPSLRSIDVPPSVAEEGSGAFVTGARGTLSVSTSTIRMQRKTMLAVVACVVSLLIGVTLAIEAFSSNRGRSERTDDVVWSSDDETCTMEAIAWDAEGDEDDGENGKVGFTLHVMNNSDKKISVTIDGAEGADGDFKLVVAPEGKESEQMWFDENDDDTYEAKIKVSSGKKVLETYEFTAE